MKQIFTFVVLFSFAFGIAIIILDWLSGCGQIFIHADGSRHLGECVGRDIARSLFQEAFK